MIWITVRMPSTFASALKFQIFCYVRFFLLPRLLDELPDKFDDLGGRLQHLGAKPLPILADFKSGVKFHHLLRLGKKLLVLSSESGECLARWRATILPSMSVGPPAAKLIRKTIFLPG